MSSSRYTVLDCSKYPTHEKIGKLCSMFTLLVEILVENKENCMISVSPSPKKGHGKVAKKGHFLTRGNVSKGHF